MIYMLIVLVKHIQYQSMTIVKLVVLKEKVSMISSYTKGPSIKYVTLEGGRGSEKV